MKILIFLSAIFFNISAFAAVESQRYLNAPPLNRDVKITKDIFEQQTKLVEEVPAGDATLGFRLRLPKDWQKLEVAAPEDAQAIGELLRYLGPAQFDIRSSFKITAYQLDFIMTAKNWFINYLMTNNYTLQGMDVSDARRVQAHYVTVENGIQYVVRAAAQISGSKILLAEYSVPIEYWPQQRDFAIRAMASFVLTSPDPKPPEELLEHSFANLVKFQYPASWLLAAAPIRSVDRMTAALANIKGGRATQDFKRNVQSFDPDAVLLDGRIDIAVVAKAPEVSLSAEAASLKQSLAQKGLILGELIEPLKGLKTAPGVTLLVAEAYKINNAQNKLVNYEEWVLFLETGDRIFVVNMLTLGRNEDFYTWTRNVEALNIVLASLKP